MNNDATYTVKITAGFEQNVRYVGTYATKADAIAAARAMKLDAGPGEYYLAVPARPARSFDYELHRFGSSWYIDVVDMTSGSPTMTTTVARVGGWNEELAHQNWELVMSHM